MREWLIDVYWALRRFLDEARYQIRHFPSNTRRTWKFAKVYYNTDDCDWSSIAIVLRHQIHQVRVHIKAHDIIADADRVTRQMLIAEHLLTRMLEGMTYYDIAEKRYPERTKQWADMVHEIERQDMQMLLRQLRYLQHWWD